MPRPLSSSSPVQPYVVTADPSLRWGAAPSSQGYGGYTPQYPSYSSPADYSRWNAPAPSPYSASQPSSSPYEVVEAVHPSERGYGGYSPHGHEPSRGHHHHEPAPVRRPPQVQPLRNSSVGYGSKTSSLERAYPIPRKEQEFFRDLTRCARHIKGVQPVFQPYMPGIPGAGVCNGLTREWLYQHSRLPSSEASRAFGRAINEDLQRIYDTQMSLDRRVSELVAQVMAEGGSVDDSDFFKNELASAEAPGLQLQAQKRGRLDRRSATSSVDAICRQMTADGFYRISLQPNGHVMGARISKATGEFKFMDSNTGEFSASRFESFAELLTNNFSRLGYHRQFNTFEVSRFN